MKKIHYLLISLALLAAYNTYAQNAVMNVRSRSSAPAGQPFQISFEVNAKASNFKVPTMKNLNLVGGPSTGYSSSTSIVNGTVTRSENYTFTIIVQADAEGTANIGAASCTVDGHTVSSKPFSIKIEKASSAPSRQQNQGGWGWGQPQQQQQPQPQQTTKIDNTTLFARASINKSNLYQGEEAIIVYKIYTQVPLTQFMIDKLPRNKGFWSEDLSENMTQVRQYSETVNGKQYQVAEIRRGALYPQQSGKLTIAPLKTNVIAIIQSQMQRQRTGTLLDFFIDDPFFTPTRQQAVEKALSSNSISVNVKPLPEAPQSFAGGVGNFSVKAKTDINTLHANEAFTYSVTISGRGNLSLLEAPQVEFPKGMEVYEPRIIDNINKGDNGLSGSRTFEWVVTPQTQGEYDMPDFEYTFFDPVAERYVTNRCNAIHISVSKPLHTAATKSDVKELNSDIHHIVKNARLRSNDGPSPLFWLLLILPVAAAAAATILVRRQQDIASDEASMKLQRATKLAKKRLRNAERHLNDGNDELFYEEIYKALWGGIADKFNIQQSLLSSETISKYLNDKNVDNDLQQRILKTLSDVDFARFAPGDSSATKKTIYDEAMNTIMQISAIKIKSKNRNHGTAALLLLLAIAPAAMAQQSTDQLFANANQAYDSGAYDIAINGYTQLIDNGIHAWQLYYNLGNAYYRSDEIGMAVLNYERALRLAPNKQIVKDNLALAHSKTTDNIDELPRVFFMKWFDTLISATTPRGWRIVVVILLTVSCALLCLFLITSNYRTRKTFFILSCSALLLLLFSSVNATFSAKRLSNSNKAIVISPMLVVKGSPDSKSVDKFIIHEGTKVTVTDRQDQWWQIEIADGKNGWIDSGAEII